MQDKTAKFPGDTPSRGIRRFPVPKEGELQQISDQLATNGLLHLLIVRRLSHPTSKSLNFLASLHPDLAATGVL
jgi:hypothetical protein